MALTERRARTRLKTTREIILESGGEKNPMPVGKYLAYSALFTLLCCGSDFRAGKPLIATAGEANTREKP